MAIIKRKKNKTTTKTHSVTTKREIDGNAQNKQQSADSKLILDLEIN